MTEGRDLRPWFRSGGSWPAEEENWTSVPLVDANPTPPLSDLLLPLEGHQTDGDWSGSRRSGVVSEVLRVEPLLLFAFWT